MPEHAAKLSFVTINYNNAAGLENTLQGFEALRNVEPQLPFEVVIVDGASTDKSKDVIKRFRHVVDTVISEPDKGIYDAMTKGVGLAAGQFINFMNAGDRPVVDGFDYFLKTPTDESKVYWGEVRWTSETPGFPIFTIAPRLLRMPNHQAMIFPTWWLRQHPFDQEHLRIAADLDHKMKAWSHSMLTALGVDLCLASPDGVSQKLGTSQETRMRINEVKTIAKRYLSPVQAMLTVWLFQAWMYVRRAVYH